MEEGSIEATINQSERAVSSSITASEEGKWKGGDGRKVVAVEEVSHRRKKYADGKRKGHKSRRRC